MSWFGGTDAAAELDRKIEEATSESIPNGELDIAVGLEITDIVRSKKVEPKQAMRQLKKRLKSVLTNPNTLSSTLKLVDLCVKNCGSHFLKELNSKEFVDYLVEYIFKLHYDIKDYKVYTVESKLHIGNQILRLIKEWCMYFKNQFSNNYLDRQYKMLVNQGYQFPDVDLLIVDIAANFIDSEAPPDWVDGKLCMICYSAFSVVNRKHHCRACGGVFCQTHSSNNIPLVSLGILLPVRVCDDCFEIHKKKNGQIKKDLPKRPKESSSGDDEDSQLRRAIELSLQDLQPSSVPTHSSSAQTQAPSAIIEDDEDMDPDLKAAIEASLKELQPNASTTYTRPASPPHALNPFEHTQPTEPDLYANLMPFDTSRYDQQPAQDFSYAQHEQPYPGQTLLPPAPIISSQTPPFHRPTPEMEELTSDDEETISKFVQEMHAVKSDRLRQAQIIYDSQLSDLYSRVVVLRPKLNRSLRNAIQKYETFVEMNNKLSTIAKLYDRFLEAKLEEAYGRHRVSLPYQQYSDTYNSADADSKYALGYVVDQSDQSRRQSRENYFQSETNSPIAAQETGASRTSYERQSFPAQESNYANYGAYGNPQRENEQIQNGSRPVQTTPRRTSKYNEYIPYPVEETSSQEKNRYDAQPSEPDFGDDEESEEREFEGNEETPNQQYEQNSAYYNGDEIGANQYPLEFSAPPEGNKPLSRRSTEVSSAAARYPPLEGFSDEEELAPQSTAPKQHAATRYPAVENINTTVADLPSMPQMPELSKVSTAESKRYRSEPEPLIEL